MNPQANPDGNVGSSADQLGTTIPIELGLRLQETNALDRAPETLHDFAALLSASPSGVTLDAAGLCCAGASPHQLVIDGATRYTHCVLDALLLPVIEGRAGRVLSTSPTDGKAINFAVSPSETTADPPEAVVSLGMLRSGTGSFYELGCPYINAFASVEEYARWAEATPEAITMSLSLADTVELVRVLADLTTGDAQ
ncbi:MAG: organomercurial lyase [Candidatus Dormiibacterota bacterium]